jgi:hypothetical protein
MDSPLQQASCRVDVQVLIEQIKQTNFRWPILLALFCAEQTLIVNTTAAAECDNAKCVIPLEFEATGLLPHLAPSNNLPLCWLPWA